MSKATPPPFYEDAEIGGQVECAGSRRLDHHERSGWIGFTGDPTPRFGDGSDRLHPLTVLAAAHGMLAQRFSENATELGIANLVVSRPATIGALLRTGARVIGARSDNDHPTGVIWMQVTARDDAGILLSYITWFRLPKRDAWSETPRNSMPSYPSEIEPRELSIRAVGELPQAQADGGRFFFEDYEPGERIAHTNSLRLNPGDCSRFARTYRMRASRFHTNLPVAPVPLLLGIGYSLAHEGFELRTGLAGINALRTPHPMLEGTRIRALTQVIATQPLNDTLGAVRLRLYLFGDHLPDPNAPKVNDGTRYYNHIGMDMDYWELIPTIKGARGVVRGR